MLLSDFSGVVVSFYDLIVIKKIHCLGCDRGVGLSHHWNWDHWITGKH